MTEKLYLNDSYKIECSSRVLSCVQQGAGYAVQLDRTPFFPTGGGQPHDTGFIGDAAVTDVIEDGDEVVHITDKPLTVDTQVLARVNWARRFDHMQQHSGEHLLSFAVKELYGLRNIGFHMAQTYCTVDFEAPLTPEQIAAIETRTNALVALNLPVFLTYVDAEKLDTLALRKAATGLDGDVRIVHMPGGDSCTCCGTHVRRTGEIGMVKVTEAAHYKGGERLTFVCGARALYHAQRTQDALSEVARAYSCKADDAPSAVKKQQTELAHIKRERKSLYTRLFAYLADEWTREARTAGKLRIIVREADIPIVQLRPLAQALLEKNPGPSLIVAREDDTLGYILTVPESCPLDIAMLMAAVNAALGGKGGGRKPLAQGSAKPAPGLKEALAQLEEYFYRVVTSKG